MSDSLAKAYEIEALTFIYAVPEPKTPAERSHRWSKPLNEVWIRLRHRSRRSADFTPAADWTFPGL